MEEVKKFIKRLVFPPSMSFNLKQEAASSRVRVQLICNKVEKPFVVTRQSPDDAKMFFPVPG
jgi:hypothetical protein